MKAYIYFIYNTHNSTSQQWIQLKIQPVEHLNERPITPLDGQHKHAMAMAYLPMQIMSIYIFDCLQNAVFSALGVT